MDNNRDFVAEQPRNSEMYRLSEWQELAARFEVAWTYVDQCMAGLVGRKTGLPIRKATEFWASKESL
eukprot:1234828-Prorocentrum_lima.AAC.1